MSKRTDITARVKQYREERGFNGGLVIIGVDGEIGGWIDELRNPEHWMPGCVAVDADGNKWVATGGNNSDGAKTWEPVI